MTTPSEPSVPSGGPSWGSPSADPTWGTPPSPSTPLPGAGDGPSWQVPSGGPGPAGPQAPRGAAFFDGVRALGVGRPDHGRWFAGVCAGVARRWGLPTGLVRIAFVVLGALTGVGLLVYGLAWMLLPHQDGRIHLQQAMQGVVTAGFLASVLAVLADSPLGVDGPILTWHRGPGLLLLALIALTVWAVSSHRRTRHHGC